MTYTYSMNAERILMAFLVAIAFALVLTAVFAPIGARAMTRADYADIPNVKATTTPITTAKASVQPLPVKPVEKMTEAEQRALIAELIRQIQALIIQLQKQQALKK